MKFKACFFFILFIGTLHAQNFEDILASGSKDASVYLGNYLEPVYNGLIYNLGGGWYHSGKTHKKLGFDITINALASFVPSSDKTFIFKNSEYTFLELESGLSQDALPTAMGQTSNKRIAVKIPIDALGNTVPLGSHTGFKVASFETLDGIEDELPVAAIPTPMIQVGVGLFAKTDLKIRLVPGIGGKDVKMSLYGIGLQHDLMQYFGVAEKTPILDVSVLGAYTATRIKYTPEDSSVGVNQETDININAYTLQLVGGLNLKIVNFYAGLGYVGGKASTKVKGEYTFNYSLEDISGVPISGEQTETVTDPIDFDYKLTGMKATIGMRINAAWFKLFADYSIQQYNTANMGISFSFR